LRRLGRERFHDGLIVRIHGGDGGLDVKDADGGIAGINASPILNVCELSRCGAAGKTKLCPNALARRRESFATTSKKLGDRHFLALAKVFANHRRGRIALFRQTIGKLNSENDLWHLRRRREVAFQRWKVSSRPRISHNQLSRCQKSFRLRSAIDPPVRARFAGTLPTAVDAWPVECR